MFVRTACGIHLQLMMEYGVVIDLFSDSDWAAHKGHRRSVSSGAIFFQGRLLLAASRTQRRS